MTLLSRSGLRRVRGFAATADTDFGAELAPVGEVRAGVRATPRAPDTALRSLRSGFSWALAGNLVYGASQWGMLTAIAKFGDPAMVGQFALAFAITAPAFMAANLNLTAVLSTDATREHRFADYYTLRLLTTALALVCLVAIVQLTDYPGDTEVVILAVIIAKSFEAVSDIFLGLFQQRERMDMLGKSLLMKGPLSLLAVAAGMYFTGRVAWSAFGILLVWAAMLALYDRPRGKSLLAAQPTSERRQVGEPETASDEVRIRLGDWGTLGHLARLALPMGFVAFANSVIPNTPRYFVEQHLGVASLGIFAAMAYVYIAGQMVVSSLANPARPRLALYFARGDRGAFTALTLRLVALGAVVGAVAVLVAVAAGRFILTAMYAPEYGAHAGVFVVLMTAAAFSYVGYMCWNSATAARCFDSQVPLFATAIVVTLGACALLVPRFGLIGAGLAVLVSALVQLIGSTLILVRAVRSGGQSGRERMTTAMMGEASADGN